MTLTPSEMIWTAVNFVVLMLVLNRLLFRPYLELMDRRRADVRAALSEGEAADERVRAHAEALRGGEAAKRAEDLQALEALKTRLSAQEREKRAAWETETRRQCVASAADRSAREQAERARMDAAAPALTAELLGALLGDEALPRENPEVIRAAAAACEGRETRT